MAQCLLFSRMLFFVGLGLQVAGGCLEGSDSTSDVAIGVKLVKARYSCADLFLDASAKSFETEDKVAWIGLSEPKGWPGM